MIFDAEELARGWLSVSYARSKDKERPQLRCLLIEPFAGGVRLVATDSYVLLRSWVSTFGDGQHAEPDDDEAPMSPPLAVFDPDGRGAALLAHLLHHCDEDHRYDVRFTTVATKATGKSLEGFEPKYATLTFDGADGMPAEQVRLPVYEGEYPNWRNVWCEFEPEATAVVALGPASLAPMARLVKLHADLVPVTFEFGGDKRPARITLRSNPEIRGLVMPVRVELPTLEPVREAVADMADAGVDSITVTRPGEEPVTVDVAKHRRKRGKTDGDAGG